MLLHPSDQYHLGIVVDDFETARASFTELLGYEWGTDVQVELVLATPEGTKTFAHRLQYSITEPRLEIIQSVPGTPFQPSTAGLHHYGYWADDGFYYRDHGGHFQRGDATHFQRNMFNGAHGYHAHAHAAAPAAHAEGEHH